MSDNHRFPPTLRVGILVFDEFEPLDVWGFTQAFTISRFIGTNYGSPPPYPFETFLIASDGKPVRSINGPAVMPDWDFAQALQPVNEFAVHALRGQRPRPELPVMGMPRKLQRDALFGGTLNAIGRVG